MSWTLADMPRQDGRTAVVTGANSGIGYETARALAQAGARVIIAARDEGKGREAAATIGHGAAWRALDLADLKSGARFADWLTGATDRLDLLILNAGVMALPVRQETADGFERQIGVNHLGHFALAARVWRLVAATPGARVVSLSSIAARRGRIDLGDLMSERRYDAWGAYCQSKLATLIFARQLAQRIAEAGLPVASLAAHPGFARTRLIANGPGRNLARDLAVATLGGLISQSAAAGALPVLRAATDPALASGDYIGSTGLFELKGPPGPAALPPAALDEGVAERLWTASARLVGRAFRF